MAERMVVRAAAILLGLGLAVPMGAVSPAQAVTCAEVRAMSAAEIAYWAKRLEVSPQHLDALLKRAFCEVPNAQRTASSTSTANKSKANPAR